MSMFKCCAMLLISLVIIEAGRWKRAVTTDCAQLKTCVTAVAAKKGCECNETLQNEIEEFSKCLKEKNVRDRCPDNLANHVCYNFKSPTCDSDVDNCYTRFYENLTAVEEVGFSQCMEA